MNVTLATADTLNYSKGLPDGSVDLVLGSPPYEAQRLYAELQFRLRGQDYIDWCVERFVEHVRISRGLVAWVVEGYTKSFRWSAAPSLLMADLHRRGVRLRKPPIFRRIGIPGSGGPDFLRNDYEFIVCASKGKLPWSDNTAMAKPCRFPPGGAMSNRNADGRRINSATCITKVQTRRKANGYRPKDGLYKMPALANPGNIISCKVGGGAMGSKIAHENEAPFPERLVEFFIRSFCPPGGTVYDPFMGRGTTGAVAIRTGRQFIGTDIRDSQIELTKRRLATVQRELIA